MGRRKKKSKKQKCFYCDKVIGAESPSYIGIDRPYINIPFHKDCVLRVHDYGEEKYLKENKKKVIEWADAQDWDRSERR